MHTIRMAMVMAMAAVGLAAALAGCGERPQTAVASHRKDDTPAYKGAEGDPFMAKNWTPGDRTSWESQIRARGQYQNEYNKTP
ncbi:hypothetical protein [Ralstonia solanacearum]|nr:hypothetical protein [Ralstonia solanacearum]AMP69654.1 hypothetical protein UW163_09305 [Ralstonia solanacearum]AMP73439.1 hypothetical protein RALBFv3_04355 [Ralstonia solanacearum]AYB60035.1 hypothetical protein C2124_05225 [Ralstonia solanacearum]MBB6586841.1 hypothetical protein [Ralstonia solanacearum]MCG3573411.1 hypothetical protein [Ralstonia solanacearum]